MKRPVSGLRLVYLSLENDSIPAYTPTKSQVGAVKTVQKDGDPYAEGYLKGKEPYVDKLNSSDNRRNLQNKINIKHQELVYRNLM